MLNDFIDFANTLRTEYLLKTETLFVRKIHTWSSDFASNLLNACCKIQKLQTESALPVVSYLEYSMFYINFMEKRYVAEICVYGEERYSDKKQRIIGSYDISDLFTYFDELWESLIAAKNRYAGLVSSRDIYAANTSLLLFKVRAATQGRPYDRPLHGL